jgi:hypothetical protein
MNVELPDDFFVRVAKRLLNKKQLCKDTQLTFTNILLDKAGKNNIKCKY